MIGFDFLNGGFLFRAIIFIGFLVVAVVVVVVVVFLKLWSGILTGDLNSGYLVGLAGVVVEDQERLGTAVEAIKFPFEPSLVFVLFSPGLSQNDTVSDISGGCKLL